jgi:hypothetical protein
MFHLTCDDDDDGDLAEESWHQTLLEIFLPSTESELERGQPALELLPVDSCLLLKNMEMQAA